MKGEIMCFMTSQTLNAVEVQQAQNLCGCYSGSSNNLNVPSDNAVILRYKSHADNKSTAKNMNIIIKLLFISTAL